MILFARLHGDAFMYQHGKWVQADRRLHDALNPPFIFDDPPVGVSRLPDDLLFQADYLLIEKHLLPDFPARAACNTREDTITFTLKHTPIKHLRVVK